VSNFARKFLPVGHRDSQHYICCENSLYIHSAGSRDPAHIALLPLLYRQHTYWRSRCRSSSAFRRPTSSARGRGSWDNRVEWSAADDARSRGCW